MNLTDIMRALHSSVDIKTFRPLVKEDINEEEWETLEEICNRNNLEIDKFYLFPEATIKDRFIYCDYNNGVYLGLDNLNKEYVDFMCDTFKRLPGVTKWMKDKLDNKQWSSFYSVIPDCVRFWDFSKRYKSMTKKEAREIFKQIYEHIDFVKEICYNIDEEMLNYIKYNNGIHKYKTIYRGAGDESTDLEDALSWTTNLNIALFFASRQKGSKVYKARVKDCNILMKLNNRNEDEVLVKYKDLEDIEEMDFISGDMINVLEYRPIFEGLNAFYQRVQKAVGLRCLYSSDMDKSPHGLSHGERVTWLSCIIVNDIVANTKGYPGFEPKDTIKLMLAALFHDCGRTNDNAERHGEKGVFKVKNNKDRICKAFSLSDIDFKEILFLIENHDFEDLGSTSKIGKLLSILKDADALDRVRLSHYRDEFDYNMLRTEEAKRLVLLSAFMYDNKIVEQIKEYF